MAMPLSLAPVIRFIQEARRHVQENDGDLWEESQFQRRALIGSALALLALVGTTHLLVTMFSTTHIPALLRVWWAYAIVAACLFAAIANRPRLGWMALLILGTTLLVLNALDSGGLFAPQWMGAALLILVAGRFLHPLASVFMGGVFAAVAVYFSHLHALDAIPYSEVASNLPRRLSTVLQFIGLSGVIAWVVYRNHGRQVKALVDAKAQAEIHAAKAKSAGELVERVFRESPVAMAIFDAHSRRIEDCNPAYLQLVERPFERVIGRTGAELDLWIDKERRTETHQRFAQGERVFNENFDIRTASGRIRHCTLSWHRIHVEGKELVLSTLNDVTERVIAARAVAESERRFQDFAQASGDWFWETDAKGRLVWLSESVTAVLGMTPEELIGTKYSQIDGGEIVNVDAWAAYRRAVASMLPFRDLTVRRLRDGALQWLRLSGTPCWGHDGQFKGYRGAGVDVSDRFRADAAATLADQRLRLAIEHLDEMFVLCDAEDRVVQANHKFTELLGPEGLGLPADSTYAACFRAAVAQGRLHLRSGMANESAIDAVLNARRRGESGIEIQAADGRWLLQSNRCLADASVITTSIDITGLKKHESMLAASENRLRQILDLTPAVAVQEFDEAGRILYWNKTSEHLYGFSASEALGQSLDRLFWTSEEFQNWLDGLKKMDSTGASIGPIETTIRNKQGQQRSILYSSFAVHSADGPVRYVCMDIDISDRKKAEDALRANQALLETVIDAIPLSVFVKNLQSTYVLVNKAFAEFHGVAKADILGRSTHDLPAPEETRRKSLADDHRVFESGVVFDQPETLLKGPNGEGVPFHSLKLPLRDGGGKVVGLVGINRNLTHDKATQAAMRASEARFSALFHKSLVPQIVSNPANRETEDVNQAFSDMIGYPREVLLGPISSSPALFWDAEDDALVGKITQDGGTTTPVDVHARRADGSKIVVNCSAFTLDTPTGPRVAWAIVDVTAQRQAQMSLAQMNLTLEAAVAERTARLHATNEELQGALERLQTSQEALIHAEKLASLGRLVAGVSHELNTPIGNSLLMSTTLNDETRRFVEASKKGEVRRSTFDEFIKTCVDSSDIIQRNLSRAAELIRSFKQVAVDQSSSTRRKFDLREVVEELLRTHHPLIRQHDIKVEFTAPEGLQLDSYPGPLGQVLGNLLTNAILHASSEHSSLRIEIACERKGRDQVQLTFSDNGVGIAPDNIKRIFDPFFTTKLGHGGSGLGLNIAYSIVTGVLGGSIKVSSQQGIGTAFTIRMPFVAPIQAEKI